MDLYHLRQGLHVIASSWDYHRGAESRVSVRGNSVRFTLVGEMFWIVLTPLWSKWLGTGFTLLVLTLVLSRLFAHVLVFEFRWKT
jgi:hypothetical protein